MLIPACLLWLTLFAFIVVAIIDSRIYISFMFWVISCRFVFWLLARKVHTLNWMDFLSKQFQMLFFQWIRKKRNQWLFCFPSKDFISFKRKDYFTFHNFPIYDKCQTQSACVLAPQWKLGSSRRFKRYPTTYMWVSSWLPFTVD